MIKLSRNNMNVSAYLAAHYFHVPRVIRLLQHPLRYRCMTPGMKHWELVQLTLNKICQKSTFRRRS